MSKKPASLTSDLLARKGEAEPSTIDPSARMTLTAGSGFDDEHGGSHGGRQEPHLEGDDGHDDHHDDEPRFDTAPDIVARRPVPPEPEIIYTAEETQTGGGNARLLLIAILGLVIVGGIFLAMSGQERNGVAPVAPNVADVAPVENVAPVTTPETNTADTNATAPVETTPETVTTTPPANGNAPMAINPAAPVAEAPAAQTPVTEAPVTEAPVAEAPVVPETPAPVAEVPAAPAAPVVAPKAQSGGAYVVQLLALQDEAAAKAAWKKVAKKHSNILGGHALDIEQANLGAKGTWYRVRAAGFASKAAATSACTKLKAAGQDCMAKKR